MSLPKSLYETIDIGGETVPVSGSGPHAPRAPQPAPPAKNQTSQCQSHVSDSSDILFATYLKIAEGQDRRRAESLRADTDQILVFCGLFSATVAALVVVSMQDLRPSNQELATLITAYYLSLLPQAIANPNISSPLPPLNSIKVITSSPPKSAILVNSLWLLSLLISLSCALIAISLQQWARRDAKVTPGRYSLPEQARMRAFFAAGIERMNFSFFVEALPVLVHISLFLFFAGFLVFVLGFNNTVFAIACCWIGLFIAAYAYITFLPMFRPDSPFYTPLSDSAALVYAGTSRAFFHVLSSMTAFGRVSQATRERFHLSRARYSDWFLRGMMSFAEEKVQELSSEIDGYVLKQTLDTANNDHDVEQIFEGILGLCDSKMVHDPQSSFDTMGRKKLAGILESFWKRALLSSVGSDAVRERRIVTCVKVIDTVRLSSEDLGGLLQSVEIGHSLKSLNTGSLGPLAQILVSGIISNVQERDDRWFTLTMDQLGVPRDFIRTYLAHGDSVLLANLINILRRLFNSLLHGDLDLTLDPFRLLPSVTKFDIQDTLHELQRDFCALWNEIIRQARNGGPHVSRLNEILVQIQHLYIALHCVDVTRTDFFASTTAHDDIRQLTPYPSCHLADHYSNTFSHKYKVASYPTGRATPASTTTQYITRPATTPDSVPPEFDGLESSAQANGHSESNSSRTAAISSPDTSTSKGTFLAHDDDNQDLRLTTHTEPIHQSQPRIAADTPQPPILGSSENPTSPSDPA
ncbi:hypothetical protein BC826DRAFT_972524 [Russula brevipes]|nr:hypothetical protein BC826DRAFT_972524 [Russula brevipes]